MVVRTPRPVNGLAAALASGDTLAVARAYVALGLSVIPLKTDGTKSPLFFGWREFSGRRPTDAELCRWFGTGRPTGVGLPGGPAAGNLIVLDFEEWGVFNRWAAKLTADERAALARSPVVRTPGGGAHVYLRLVESVKGCCYAKDPAGEVLIETRGSGQFVVAPGSPAAVHPTGTPYRLLRPGWLDGAPCEPMHLETFHNLTVHAAELNLYTRPAAREVVGDRPAGEVGDRPGDHFGVRALWGDVLGPHGWRVYRSTEATTYWCRPGKSPAGISASTGFCRGQTGGDLLYVFSTSAAPFEAERSYSKFAAYALLNHHGDYAAASRALRLVGYGGTTPRKAVPR